MADNIFRRDSIFSIRRFVRKAFARPPKIDEFEECEFHHYHLKGQECKLCRARVLSRVMKKI